MPTWFTQDLTNIATAAVYVAIGVLFILSLLKCVAPVAQSRRILRAAIHQIKLGDKAQRSWQDDTFLGKGALYPHWSDYLTNLFFADGEFHNPSNVEDFINEETAIHAPGRARFAEAAPSMMVTLGFLGTLIGISNGLQGFNMDNAEQVMAAIRRLVPGMQYAFTTSIVGASASLLTTLLTRIVNGSAASALDQFYAAMNKYAGVLSVDPMTQIAIYQQEQTALIQRMAKDLSGAMTERMAEAMGKTIGESLGSIKDSLEHFSGELTREQLRAVDLLVERYLTRMNDAVDGQFTKLGATLEATNRNQQLMNDGMKDAMQNLSTISQNIVSVSRLSDTMLSKYEETIGRLNATSRLAEEGYGQIAEATGRLSIVATQQNGAIKSLTAMQDELAAAITAFQEGGARLSKRFADESARATGALVDAAGALRSSGDTLAKSHQALVGGVTNDIDHAYNTFFKSTDDAMARLQWLIDDLNKTLSAMPDMLESTAALYARQADGLTDALRRARSALEETTDALAPRG